LLPGLNSELRAVVHDVVRLTPNIVEVIVHAPIAARAFDPGQFYRLQNYESLAAAHERHHPGMEGLALTGAWVDREKGLLSTIVLEMGGSSDSARHFEEGEPVILMGPTGSPTETSRRTRPSAGGGGLGNAVLFSIGQALRANGSKVLYFAGYKKVIDRYKVEEIEARRRRRRLVLRRGAGLRARPAAGPYLRRQHRRGDGAYASGKLGAPEIPLHRADRIIAIGSDGMMARWRGRATACWPVSEAGHKGIGSINSPMQCMMKEICAQCLQLHKDPTTGEETVVFSCFNQDQSLDNPRNHGTRSRSLMPKLRVLSGRDVQGSPSAAQWPNPEPDRSQPRRN
jgi:NAD(P)H-flavin reductase